MEAAVCSRAVAVVFFGTRRRKAELTCRERTRALRVGLGRGNEAVAGRSLIVDC